MLDQCRTSHILFLLLCLRLKGNLFCAFLPFSLCFESHSLQHHISPATVCTTLGQCLNPSPHDESQTGFC